MRPRLIRCANARLYLFLTLLVLAAAAYVGHQPDSSLLQQWGAWAAGLLTLAWGGYYATLQYRTDSRGITRKLFWLNRQRIEWSDITHADVQEESDPETASCTLSLTTASGQRMQLGSDLLPLDEVQQLVAEMRRAGLLPAPKAGHGSL